MPKLEPIGREWSGQLSEHEARVRKGFRQTIGGAFLLMITVAALAVLFIYMLAHRGQ